MTVSIEYAHTYTNEVFGEEQKRSIDLMLKKEHSLLEQDDTIVYRLIMVDDYSVINRFFDYDSFENEIYKHGGDPHVYIREGQLRDLARDFIDNHKKKSKRRSYKRYIESRRGYLPCSLFIATWYLVRLGYLEDPLMFSRRFVADRTVTILPARFKHVEDLGVDLIRKSRYSEAVDRIEQIYFEDITSGNSPEL